MLTKYLISEVNYLIYLLFHAGSSHRISMFFANIQSFEPVGAKSLSMLLMEITDKHAQDNAQFGKSSLCSCKSKWIYLYAKYMVWIYMHIYNMYTYKYMWC